MGLLQRDSPSQAMEKSQEKHHQAGEGPVGTGRGVLERAGHMLGWLEAQIQPGDIDEPLRHAGYR